MTQRILSTALLWTVLVLLLVWLGPLAGLGMVALAAFLAQNEFYRLLEKANHPSFPRAGLMLGMFILFNAYFMPQFPALYLSVLISFAIALVEGKGRRSLVKLMSTLMGILYIPFLMAFLIMTLADTYSERGGVWLTLWLVVVAKFTDVGGLLFGTLLGKHKMAPGISPNKTWEGTVGGIISGTLAGLLYASLLHPWLPPNFTVSAAFAIAFPISVAAVFSDLSASLCKRMAGEKDTGSIIPGIGGALDLVDSILLSAPLGYLLIGTL